MAEPIKNGALYDVADKLAELRDWFLQMQRAPRMLSIGELQKLATNLDILVSREILMCHELSRYRWNEAARAEAQQRTAEELFMQRVMDAASEPGSNVVLASFDRPIGGGGHVS